MRGNFTFIVMWFELKSHYRALKNDVKMQPKTTKRKPTKNTKKEYKQINLRYSKMQELLQHSVKEKKKKYSISSTNTNEKTTGSYEFFFFKNLLQRLNI